jgi:hypothetical protein
VARLKNIIGQLYVPIGVLVLQACSGLGYMGGAIPTTFSGLDTAIAVSPQTIQLNWTAYPGASKYNIYSPDKNDPVYTPGFNSIIFKPVPNDPTLTYQYSVTAIDPSTGKEQGERSQYSSVQLLPHFNFRDSGGVTTIGKNSIRVTWDGHPSVSYKVYVAERLPTGSVNYNSFVATNATVVGASSATVAGLAEGHEYCAVVIAAYSDLTYDDPVGTTFTTDPGATLSRNTYLVGPSGNFGDSLIASAQKCVRTQSDFSVASMKIYAQKASLSNQPIFYVSAPPDTTEDTNGTVSTSIYQVNETTNLSTLVGTRIGTGKLTAQSAIPSGRYKYFAVVNDISTPGATAQAKVEVIAGPTGTTPTSDQDRKYVYVRSFNDTETAANTLGYYPEKQQAGYGSQKAGSAVAIGDFNCDGKKDIAIGVPDASIMAADNRPAKQGKVIVYYGVDSATPATTTRIQTISFDITGLPGAGDPARDLRLGTSLFAGNFNGDVQATNQNGGSGLSSSFKCDDLAIGSGYGPMFVLYGKRDVIGNDGGLNYTNATSFTQNPSASCDPSQNVCGPAVYTQGTNYTSAMGTMMTSGDFNGDGYEDLAITSSNGGHGIWVFRGSEYGLLSPTAYNGFGETVVTYAGPYISFPYLPVTASAWAAPTPAPGWGSGNIGASISTFHNAYYDTDGATATKGTKRIRDVLLVGNSNFNQVHACIPKSDYSAAAGSWGTIGSSVDVNNTLYWDCSQVLAAPTGVLSGFGAAMVDLKNPLRYRPDQFTDTGCKEGFGNCGTSSPNLGYPGGVAVSSLSFLTGSVYVYYGVNNPVNFTPSYPTPTVADRDTMGLNRNLHLSQLLQSKYANGTAMSVVTANACQNYSNSGTSTYYEYCDIQKISHPTTQTGSFGSVLASLPGNVVTSVSQSKDTVLAVAAPNRGFNLSGGLNYSNVGSVQLYLQNSHFENDPIIVRPTANAAANKVACDTSAVCRYADGFSNSLTQSLDYDGVMSDNVFFGLGGIAAGPLLSPDADYSSNSDIVVGAPGHVARLTVGGLAQNVIDNGAAIAYFSHAGTYRNFEIADITGSNPNPSPSAWHIMDQSFSQEADLKFHEAISIGDINQDGIGDVAVRINQGSRNLMRIYSGRSDKVGLNTTAGAYTTFQIQGDSSAGSRFIPLGSITTSTLPAFLVTAKNSSYIMFAGIGGLVGGFPTAFGTGGTPRKMSNPGVRNCSAAFDPTLVNCFSYLDFSDNSFYNAETTGNLDSTIGTYQNFAHGDFNGDGYEDFAIGFNGTQTIADIAKNKGCLNNYCGNTGTGRVMIFYGGVDNGVQTQPDANGGYPLTSNYFTDYSADAATHGLFGTPCSTSGTGCKIQMMHEGTIGVPSNSFGQSMTSVPSGSCADSSNKLHKVSSLVVKGVKAGVPYLYAYRPKCLDASTPNDFSGLAAYGDLSSGQNALLNTLPTPAPSMGSTLAMTAVENLMGNPVAAPARSDLVSHLVVTDQNNSRVIVYPVHTVDSSKTVFESYTVSANGGRVIDYSSSAMMTGTNGATTLFGTGVASIGDVNGDKYSDVGIAISKLNRKDTASQTVAQGTILVLFGGPTGLQSHTNAAFTSALEPSRTASCYILPGASPPSSICNPALLYVPQSTNSLRNGAYERTSLTPYSFVSTTSATNENLGTFLIGIPGRDSLDTLPSNRILQGGAFYVLP